MFILARRPTIRALATALAALALSACGGADEDAAEENVTETAAPETGEDDGLVNGLTPEQAATVIATVGDREITAGELAERLAAEGRYTQARFASPERRREYLDKLIDLALLAAEGERLGYDQDPLVVQAREQAMREELLHELVDSQISRADVTDEEVRAYYEAHRDEYHQPAQVRAAHIVVRSRAEAERYLAEVANDSGIAKFREIARTRNIDGSRPNGGDLRFFSREGGLGPPDAVREVAFELARIGDVHPQVVESPVGFHVVKLTGRRAALERSLEDVAGPIRNAVWTERREQARLALLEELRANAEIEEHLDVLADLQVPGMESPDARTIDEAAGADEPTEESP